MNYSENYFFLCKTVQANAIKTLFEALKDIIDDVTININNEGLQVFTMDHNNCCVVHLNLLKNKFEEYFLESPINIGLNMKNLFLLLKTVGNHDVITFAITKSSQNKLTIVIENKDKQMKDVSRLNLLDLDEDELIIPDIAFDRIVKISTSDFQKICKDVSNIADTVSFKSDKKSFIIEVEGDIGSKAIVLKENKKACVYKEDEFNTISIINITDNNVNEQYSLKYILLFIKSSNLCPSVEIFLKQRNVVTFIYSVGSLGSLKFSLSPIETDL